VSSGTGYLRAGIDVGSTTVKLAVLDADDTLVFHTYERHRADIRGTLVAVIEAACDAMRARGAEVSLKARVTG
jgi:activator of 2-hydroxyglutaryl-CoA dehydratase